MAGLYTLHCILGMQFERYLRQGTLILWCGMLYRCASWSGRRRQLDAEGELFRLGALLRWLASRDVTCEKTSPVLCLAELFRLS